MFCLNGHMHLFGAKGTKEFHKRSQMKEWNISLQKGMDWGCRIRGTSMDQGIDMLDSGYGSGLLLKKNLSLSHICTDS